MKKLLLALVLMAFTSVSFAGLTVSGLVGKSADLSIDSISLDAPLVGGVSLMTGTYDFLPLPVHGIVTLLSDRDAVVSVDLGLRSYVGVTKSISLFGELGARQVVDASDFNLVDGIRSYGAIGAEYALTDRTSVGVQARRTFASGSATTLLGSVSFKF